MSFQNVKDNLYRPIMRVHRCPKQRIKNVNSRKGISG